MYVKNRMTTDIISIFPDASISLAFQTMKEKEISQLPVVKDSKLIGVITEESLKDFTPSKATTLSIYELNYVLNKTKIQDVMTTDLTTAHEDDLIESVAQLMIEQDINMVPVIKADNVLVGVICRTDILDSFIDMLGTKDSGARISLRANNEVGTLATIVDKIKDYNFNIKHITSFVEENHPKGEIVIRVDSDDVDALVDDLKAFGFEIVRVDKN